MWYLNKIPKIAHFYWGNNSLSFLRYLTIYSFRKENPDWEIRVYKPIINFQGEKTWKTMERCNVYNGEDYFEQVKQIADKVSEIDFSELGFYNDVPETYKADFLRWKLLSTTGGLWSDFDIVYIRPMDCLYFNNKKNKDISTIICFKEYHRIGFLLSDKNNSFFKYINSQVSHCFNKSDYQSIGSYIFNAAFPNISYIKKLFPDLKVFNMQMNVVYPLSENSILTLFEKNNNPNIIKNNCIAIHWFGGHPGSEMWEKLLTPENYKDYQNNLCQIIKRVLDD